MGRRVRRLVRQALVGVLGVAVFGLLALVALGHLAPMFGHQVFIIRGASMSPAIPLGSVVAVRDGSADGIVVNDVITLRMPNQVVVTHRVIGIVDQPDGRYFETRGDGNQTADPALVPVSAVIGVVDSHAPMAGYVLALLSMPTGVISIISMLIALLLGIWIIDDQLAEELDARNGRSPTPPRMRRATA